MNKLQLFNAIIVVGGNMAIKKKRRIRIKWKNLFIFILIIILLFTLIIKGTTSLYRLITTPKKEVKTKVAKETVKTEKQIKLEKLDNIQNKIDYFNEDYLDRYIEYKNKNKSLDNIQIIKNVNMNLDKEPYNYKIPSKYTNTEKILVNKYYYLEDDYVPDNLEDIDRKYALSNMRMVNVAKTAFENLSKNAKKENLNIIAMSTYRSYKYQVNLYNRYVKQDGKEKADTYSGRPGHSEHQTGLAVDVYNKKENYTNFEKTNEFKWMQEHAHEYGFILRFPKGKEHETGYTYESWHYRYVGVDIATYIHNNNISLEEYYATKIKDW